MPPMLNQGQSQGGLDSNGMGGSPAAGNDGQRAALEGMAGKVKQLMSDAAALGAEFPAAQGEIKKIRESLQRIIVIAAKAAPQQTGSAQALPTGGG